MLEGRLRVVGPRIVLGRGRSFMNESGGAVASLLSFYKVPAERLVVAHDELDLPFGALRLKLGGGDNGHNGLKSLRRHLGSGDYFRIRFGIGRPPGRQEPADYVLAAIPGSLRLEVELEVQRAADAVELLLAHGLEVAQNRFNS